MTMPKQKAPAAKLDQLAQRIDSRLDTMSQGIAERLGPASGTARYTQPQIDALWDTKDQAVDQQALYEALQQGITPEGAQAVSLFKMAPDLAKSVVGTPQPPDQAAQIAKLAEYPGRYVLTASHSPDADKQVAFVADQHKRAARRQQGIWKPDGNEGMTNTFAGPPQDVSVTVPMPTGQGGY